MADGYKPGQAFQQAQAGAAATFGGLSEGEAFQRAIMLAELAQRRQTMAIEARLSEQQMELARSRLTVDEERLAFDIRKWNDQIKLKGQPGQPSPLNAAQFYDDQMQSLQASSGMGLELKGFMVEGGFREKLSRRTRAKILGFHEAAHNGNIAMMNANYKNLGNFVLGDVDERTLGGAAMVTNLIHDFPWRPGGDWRFADRYATQWLKLVIDPRAQIAYNIYEEAFDKIPKFDIKFTGDVKWDKSTAERRADNMTMMTEVNAEAFRLFDRHLQHMKDEGIDMKIGEQEAYLELQKVRASMGETGITFHKLAYKLSEALMDPDMSRTDPYVLSAQRILSNMGATYEEWEAQPPGFLETYNLLGDMKNMTTTRIEQRAQFYGVAGIPPQDIDPRSDVALLAVPPDEIWEISKSQDIGSLAFKEAEKTRFPITNRFKEGGLFDDIIELSAREDDESTIDASEEILHKWLREIDDLLIQDSPESREGMSFAIDRLEEFVIRRAEMVSGVKPHDIIGRIDKLLKRMRDIEGFPISIPGEFPDAVLEALEITSKRELIPYGVEWKREPEGFAREPLGAGLQEAMIKMEAIGKEFEGVSPSKIPTKDLSPPERKLVEKIKEFAIEKNIDFGKAAKIVMEAIRKVMSWPK